MTKPELSTTGEAVKVFVAEAEKDKLLNRANQLNKLSEVSQVALGMCLAEIKRTEAFKPEYEDFKSYYQSELGRTKGDITKLLTVGQLMLDGGFSEATVPDVGYTKLYVAYLAFPEKPTKYLLAAAQSNTIAEMMQNKRDEDHPNCKHKNTHACTACDDCGNHTRNQEPF